jgi:thiamine biosynthesis lipoprotein
LAKKLFPFLLILSFFLSCGVQEKWHTSTLLVFDTLCELKIFCSSSEFKAAQKDVDRIFSEIESHFSPDAEDYSSSMVLDLYRRALQVFTDSDGCFDITVAPLSRLWGFLSKSYAVPTPDQLQSILERVGMKKLKEENGILLLLPGMKLDWGAIAKGFAIDLASQSLIERGISSGFINAGGDLYCWGENPDNKDWNIGIKHPRKSGFLGIISISEQGAATTGDYQRYFIKEGVRYHHVFDPHTGYPAKGKQSVTVCGPETLLCDALSTALFVSSQPEKIIEKYPDYGAIIVDSQGNLSFLGKTFPFRSVQS